MVLLARDEGVSGDNLPVSAGGVLEINDWAGEGVESPVAFDDAGYGVGAGDRVWGGLRGDGGMVRCRLGPAGLGFGYGIKREGLAVGRVGEDEASLIGVRRDRNVSSGSWAVEVEDEVVGEGGGEDQGRAFHWKGNAGFEEARDGGGVGGSEGGRDGGLDGEHGAAGVDGERPVEFLLRHVGHGGAVADAGVVDEDVERAEFFNCGGDEALDVRDACHVGLYCDGAATRAFDSGDGFGRLSGAVAMVDNDGSAGGGEGFGDGAADAAGCAGDDGDFFLEG